MKSRNSYIQIIKSASIIGGAHFFNLLFGIIRVKFVAMILGPTGIGFIGIYQSIIDILRNATGLGINMSGVKDVSHARGSGEQVHLDKSVTVLNRWAIVTGLFGAAIAAMFARSIALYTFGDYENVRDISLLSIAIFFTTLSVCNVTLLQGMHELRKMAKTQVLGALLSCLTSIPIYYIFGTEGISFSLIAISLTSFIISHYYSHPYKKNKIQLPAYDTFKSGLGMAKLGIFMTINVFVSLGLMYLVRKIIIDRLGMDSVGFFNVSYTVTTMYIGLILNSMMTDFFPRLSANSDDDEFVNEKTNEQVVISLLIGVPVIMLMIVFSKLVINILYTPEFYPAIRLLQIRVYSLFFSLVGFPVAVIALVKGKGQYSMIHDISISFINLLFVLFFWDRFSLLSTSIACISAGIFSPLILYFFAYRMTKYKSSAFIIKYALIFFTLLTVVLIANLISLSFHVVIVIDVLILLFTFYLSLRKLNSLMDFKSIYVKIIKRFVRES